MSLTFTPQGGGAPIEREVFKAPGAGVTVAMYKLDESIRGFARACFNYGVAPKFPVYLSTKNTILKVYDGRFMIIFREVFDGEVKAKFEAAGLTYDHRLIDDMVASNLKWKAGYLWTCKNYDGDVSRKRRETSAVTPFFRSVRSDRPKKTKDHLPQQQVVFKFLG